MATFRKVPLDIQKTNQYGHYLLTSTYKNKEIKVLTTDSEMYDWLNDTTDKERNLNARRKAYNLVVKAEIYLRQRD